MTWAGAQDDARPRRKPSSAGSAARGLADAGRRIRGAYVRQAGIHALVVLIVLADWLTPAGVVVGILLGVPILLSSAGDRPRDVVVVSVLSAVGFFLAAVFGRGPISPEAIWLPNRLFAITAIAASAVLALMLQRRRIDAETARRDAESSRDLSRVLHSLMAHDLRSPLALARDALAAVDGPLRSGMPVDLEMIAEVDARLGRSLRSIQLVLDAARTDLEPSRANGSVAPVVDVCREVREEFFAFEDEARAHGKSLVLDLGRGTAPARVDPSVVRQALGILVDNAIRYAEPGPVQVAVTPVKGHVHVSVRDSGPGLTRHRSRPGARAGEGLGLRLCGLLVQRAGGTLAVARDDDRGTEFVLVLPA